MRVTRSISRSCAAVVLAAALVAALLVANTPLGDAQSAQRTNPQRPTIVLLHGAFSGPSAWTQVAGRLRRDGYQVVTPALALDSVAGDVATVRDALDTISGPKILVGHSYGGFLVSNASAERTDIRALVFTAAFVPDHGHAIATLGLGYQAASFLTPGHLIVEPTLMAIINPVYFREDFAQDLSPKVAAAMAAAQGPTSLLILGTPSGPVGWHDLPSWYAVSDADRVIDPALQRWMADRAGSRIVTFDDASHAGGFTHYAARFTRLIEHAATATAPLSGSTAGHRERHHGWSLVRCSNQSLSTRISA